MAGNIGEGSGGDESASHAGARARRQWSLHNAEAGASSSLQRLRASLAEEGCWQSQLVLARQLLDSLPEGAEARRAAASRAVLYLLAASEQGSAEATELLAQCAASGLGVTDHNYIDVRESLDVPLHEKRIRHAARLLFQRLAGGQEFITTEQIRQRLRRAATSASRSAALLDDSEEEGGRRERIATFFRRVDGEKLSEAAMVSAASHLARGDLPAVSRLLCDLEEEGQWQVSLAERVLCRPEVPRSLCHWLQTAGRVVEAVLAVLPVLLLLALLGVGGGWGSVSASQCVAACLLYAALLVMTAASLKLPPLLGPDSLHVLAWSRALQLADVSLDPAVSVRRFRRKHVRPQCWRLLSAALVVAAVRWHVPPPLAANAAVVALCLFMAAVCLLACVTSTSAARGTAVLWRRLLGWLPLVACVAGALMGPASPWCSMRVWDRLIVVLSPQAVLHAVQLAGWGALAAARSATLLPRGLPALWLHLSALFSPAAGPEGVARWLVLWGVGSALLPAVTAWFSACTPSPVLLVMVVSVCCSWFSLESAAAVFGLVCCLAVTAWACQSVRWRQLCLLTLLVLVVQWSTYLVQTSTPPQFSAETPSLSWPSFQALCHGVAGPGPGGTTSVRAERKCAELVGSSVLWRAAVADVRLTDQHNWPLSQLAWLPAPLRGAVACWLDSWRPPAGDDSPPCSLRGWNSFSYSVHAELPGAVGLLGRAALAELALPAGDEWERVALSLSVGDQIEFQGHLSSRLASDFPLVELQRLRCLQCSPPEVSAAEGSTPAVPEQQLWQWGLDQLRHSCYSLITFVGSPLLFCEDEPFTDHEPSITEHHKSITDP